MFGFKRIDSLEEYQQLQGMNWEIIITKEYAEAISI